MYPAPIARYERPATIAEALEAMAGAGEGALYLAGGTAAMPAVNARALRPCALVDLGGVEELDGIAKGPRGVAIRPMTRLRNLAGVSALHGAHQAITDAAATMGDRQVRNAGTIGGGLFWKGGAACMATAALCLDAVLARLRRRRTLLACRERPVAWLARTLCRAVERHRGRDDPRLSSNGLPSLRSAIEWDRSPGFS